MKIRFLFAVLLIAICSCVNHSLASPEEPSANEGRRVIKSYSEMEADSGNNVVTLQGIAAIAHEQIGLYFDDRDLRKGNEKCVRLAGPDIEKFGLRHRMKVQITGVVRESRCRQELICLNVCGNYDVKVSDVRALNR